jgi:GT2 family glycosyltransferase/glycosyltransferase involved in cell wall biosynthesis
MRSESRDARNSSRVMCALRGLPRRSMLAGLTILLTPFLALLAVALLLLNAAARCARAARRAARAEKPEEVSGLVSIVILNWNGRGLLAQGLPSVIDAVRRDSLPHEILLIDNGSHDGSADYVRTAFPQVRVLELPENRGFAHGNNAGVRAARHDIVVLLNNDMIVDPGFLRPLLDCFGPNTFAVSSQIRNQDPAAMREETGRTSAVFRRGFIDYTHREVNEQELSRSCYPVFWAGGGSSAFHRARFLTLGGFHEIYSPAYVEDTDLSFRAWQAGWDVLFAPRSVVYHKHRATASLRFTPAELQALIQRNQLLFVWKNIRSWPLLIAHCLFLPWNCYRLARDYGLRIWRGLLQACALLPAVAGAKLRTSIPPARSDSDIFRLSSMPALFFARARARPRKSQAQPRILWVTSYLPCLGRHGGAGRMVQLLMRLARDYRITLLSFLEDEEERQFLPQLEAMCTRVVPVLRRPLWRWQLFPYEPFQEYFTPAMEQALRECLAEHDYDLIQLEYTQMARYACKSLGIPTLLTVIEADFAACARRARVESNPILKLRWFYNYLQVLDRQMSLLPRVDAAICVTDSDMRELRRFCRTVPIHVINTGVDLAYFHPPERPADGARLIYVGAYRHEPNVDAVLYFCRSVLPLVRARIPETELLIVGSEPPAAVRSLADIPGVRVTGSVPDIRPFMAESSVYVVPLRLGVGLRGKILEAWAMAMPVVTTSLGCAGLRYRDGENLMVADAPEDFAARVIMLLSDPARRRQLGLNGRKVVEQNYGWEAITSQLHNLYQKYLDIHGTS